MLNAMTHLPLITPTSLDQPSRDKSIDNDLTTHVNAQEPLPQLEH